MEAALEFGHRTHPEKQGQARVDKALSRLKRSRSALVGSISGSIGALATGATTVAAAAAAAASFSLGGGEGAGEGSDAEDSGGGKRRRVEREQDEEEKDKHEKDEVEGAVVGGGLGVDHGEEDMIDVSDICVLDDGE